MINNSYIGVPVWSEHVSETQMPTYSKATYDNNKFIYNSLINIFLDSTIYDRLE